MDDLHIFFLPFLAPGHMIPMVDMVWLFADCGARVTIVTTAGNAPLIRPTLDRANVARAQPIQLLTLPFPSSETGLPPGLENLTAVRDFGDFLKLLDGAASVRAAKPHESAAGDDEPFVVPGLPHCVEMTRSQLPLFLLGPDDDNNGLTRRMEPKQQGSLGLLVNSFYEMEREYAEHLQDAMGLRAWLVGPVSRCNSSTLDMVVREEAASTDYTACLSWLQTKKPGSVLYVCFGSTAVLSAAQVHEMAFGLEASGHPFIWAMKHLEDGSLPEGFEDRVTEGGHGVVLRGWAPQVLLLGHAGVGGVHDALRVELMPGGCERWRAHDHLAARLRPVLQRAAPRRRAARRGRGWGQGQQLRGGGQGAGDGGEGAGGRVPADGRGRRG